MGRRKVEIKKIEDKSSRQVTFSKRRNGLIKKARDLSVLCDADVGVIVLSSAGKLYDFCSEGNSLDSIVRRYQSHSEAQGKGASAAYEESTKYAGYLTTGELLQIVKRYVEEPNVEEPSISDLMQLEIQLDSALAQTRSRKTELMMKPMTSLLEQERILREENALLEREIAERKKNTPLPASTKGFNCPPPPPPNNHNQFYCAPPHTTLTLLPP